VILFTMRGQDFMLSATLTRLVQRTESRGPDNVRLGWKSAKIPTDLTNQYKSTEITSRQLESTAA